MTKKITPWVANKTEKDEILVGRFNSDNPSEPFEHYLFNNVKKYKEWKKDNGPVIEHF